MTVPDMRDTPFAQEMADFVQLEAVKMQREVVGYVCATVICVVMLLNDGIIALTAAGSVAGTLAGITVARRLA